LHQTNPITAYEFKHILQPTMSTATLDASMTRLEDIKGNKQLYNKNKIAEAEALAAEALRMANEAKMAAARLAEVKKTLAMFSSKLDKAEQSVQKDIKVAKAVVVEHAVVEAPKEEVPAEEDEFKADPPSKTLVNDDVVKVVEVEQPAPAPVEAPKAPVVEAPVTTPAPVVVPYQSDIVEDFLDGIGVDKICGVDDQTLGFTDRIAPRTAPVEQVPFVNPTRIAVKKLSAEDMVHPVSLQEETANRVRKDMGAATVQYQRQLVNEDFNDPFGVDHDDLVLCGKLADVCEPQEYDDAVYEENDIIA